MRGERAKDEGGREEGGRGERAKDEGGERRGREGRKGKRGRGERAKDEEGECCIARWEKDGKAGGGGGGGGGGEGEVCTYLQCNIKMPIYPQVSFFVRKCNVIVFNRHGKCDWYLVNVKGGKKIPTPSQKSKRDFTNFDADFLSEKAQLTPVDNEALKDVNQAEFHNFTFTNSEFHG